MWLIHYMVSKIISAASFPAYFLVPIANISIKPSLKMPSGNIFCVIVILTGKSASTTPSLFFFPNYSQSSKEEMHALLFHFLLPTSHTQLLIYQALDPLFWPWPRYSRHNDRLHTPTLFISELPTIILFSPYKKVISIYCLLLRGMSVLPACVYVYHVYAYFP